MNIAIIGAGNVGRALAAGCRRAGHQVFISSRDAEDARKVASETGAAAAESNSGAAAEAEVIIFAVPFDAVDQISRELAGSLNGKVLIDVTNRFDPLHLNGSSNAEQIQEMAPEAVVVKAFNTVFAAHQADPVVDGSPLDGFVAADHAEPKSKVLQLVESMGFRPIDAGPLAMSRALEGMALLNIALNMQNGWPWQSGWKLVGPIGEIARKAA